MTEQAGDRSVRAFSRKKVHGFSPFELDRDARLVISRSLESLAINLVARPAIWGESGVSMVNPMPDPPYKISRNFKLQSCAPNAHVNRERNKEVKFVLLEKTIKQRSLTEQARHKSNMN